MTHFLIKLITVASWFFGISAVLLAAFLALEFVQHRRTYGSDRWSEEALLEERIESGTLPMPTHVNAAEQADPLEQEKRYLAKTPVHRLSFLHKVFR